LQKKDESDRVSKVKENQFSSSPS